MDFKNKTVLITGAASGMGRLTSEQFAQCGANVMMLDINEEALKAQADQLSDYNVAFAVTDVRSYDSIENAVKLAHERFGSVDITISYAGGAATRVLKEFKPFNEMSIKAIDWGIDVNMKGPIYMARAVFNIMAEQKSGVIINIGSIEGITGSEYGAEYSAAKSGLIGFTKSIALLGAPHGVRCCCVSPGPVLTRPEMSKMYTPMGRAAAPAEIVDLVMFLCSDKASFITGDNYLVDGGRSCGAKSYED